jgi:hypothetical protein
MYPKEPFPKGVLFVAMALGVLFLLRAYRLLRPRKRNIKHIAMSWIYFHGGILAPIIFPGALLLVGVLFVSRFRTEPSEVFPLIVIGVLGYFAVKYARRLFARAKSLALPGALDLRTWDPRQPAVLMRSFLDDTQWAENKKTRWDRPGTARLERVIGSRISHYGPFVAIGEPGTKPVPGAARDYCEGEAWRKAVEPRASVGA